MFSANLAQRPLGRGFPRSRARVVGLETQLVAMKTPHRQFFRNVHGPGRTGQAQEPIEISDRADVDLEWADRAGGVCSNEKLIEREINAAAVEVEETIVRHRPVIEISLRFIGKRGANNIET